VSLFQAENQPARAAGLLDSLGGFYRQLGETQSSLDAYHQALAIHRAQKNLTEQGQTLGAIGNVYALLGQSQKALEAYNQALEIHKEPRNVAGQASSVISAASTNY
jgi:tetratricopeptide (TPR) repeat protein